MCEMMACNFIQFLNNVFIFYDTSVTFKKKGCNLHYQKTK